MAPPIHEKAMPVILNSKDEHRLWLMEGDEALLRPYEGEMEFDQLPNTLEHQKYWTESHAWFRLPPDPD